MHCRKLTQVLLCCLLIVGCVTVAAAAVRLPAVIGDNMVLQRGQPVPIWGWADKDEQITVTVAGQTVTAKAGDDGRWKVVLAKLDVGQPLTMTIKGSFGTVIPLKNILVGEVWICSGQSNMEMGITKCKDGAAESAAADYPQIRLFQLARVKAPQPLSNVEAVWAPCTPKSVVEGGWGGFSAAAYYFGRRLHKELNVPVGLIHTSWGGTMARLWTSEKTLKADPFLKWQSIDDASFLYNGMIAPLMPYAIRGVIWYQGESDIGRANVYRVLFPAMIANWRADWGQGDFPFGFVQITSYRYNKYWNIDPTICPELREAQQAALKLSPNTGMAVTVDIGDLDDIHPKNKQDVGQRLALWALAKVYGRDIVYSGPIYKSMAVEGSKIRLQFDHVGGGLISSDGKPLSDFTIAGDDRKFVPAVAEIDGNSIVVHSDAVAQPVAVRYAWRDDTTPNLVNKEKLPASPFRTDAWGRDEKKAK